MNRIDCRNMDCPAPVISVKKALESSGELEVMLDDGAPRENVVRFARNRGFNVAESRESNYWTITISSSDIPAEKKPSVSTTGSRLILITSDRLGEGAEELGRLLMKNFIHTLIETEHQPASIFMMNSAVKLACEGSELLEGLQKLVNAGVELYSCGLCLDYFGLKDKLKAGSTTNMLSTAEALLSATQVIKL